MNKKRFAVRLLGVAGLLAFCVGSSFGQGVVLWNKLGSDYEITHSEIGPNGVIQQGGPAILYDTVQFGEGINVLGTGDAPSPTAVTFNPSTVGNFNGNKGTLSYWVKPYHDSNYNGIARWANWANIRGFGPHIYWLGRDRAIRFGICAKPFDCTYGRGVINVPNSAFSFRSGEIFHVALAWDRDGIDGTSDTLRAYINGELHGAEAEMWEPDLLVSTIIIGRSDYEQMAAIDNLVIWDYAKTDFSDRFNENPIGVPADLTVTKAQLGFAKDEEPTNAEPTCSGTDESQGCSEKQDFLRVKGMLDLAEDSDGIDPLSEAVTFNAGTHTVQIPAGAFHRWNKGGVYSYAADYEAGRVLLVLKELSSGYDAGRWEFQGSFQRVDNTGTSNPITVRLTVGDDSGESDVDLYGTLKYVAPKGRPGAARTGNQSPNH